MMIVVVAAVDRGGRRLRGRRAELRCRDARTRHPVGGNHAVLDGKAAERGTERVERQTRIEQRAEDHVP